MEKEDLEIGGIYGSLRLDDFSAAPVRLVDDHYWTSTVGRLHVTESKGPRSGVLALRSSRPTPGNAVWDEHAADLSRLELPVPGLITDDGQADQRVLDRLRVQVRQMGLRLALDNSSRWGGPWLAYTQMRRNFLMDLSVQEAKAHAFQKAQEAKKRNLQRLIGDLGVRAPVQWQSTPVQAHPYVHMEAVSHVQMSVESLQTLLSAALEARLAERSD